MKNALTTLMVCGLVAGTVSAEKTVNPGNAVVSRFQLNGTSRVADCVTVSGLPVGYTAVASVDVPVDACDWTITSCGAEFVDSWFVLKDENGVVVAENDDERCSYSCNYGPAVVGSAWGDGCLTAGLYSLEIYVYSYRDGGCDGTGGFDWDICFDFNAGSADTEDLPNSMQLGDAYPNPFNPSTTIQFSLAETAQASLKVFNLAGDEVATLVDGLVGAGVSSVNFDATGLTSGVYFYTLQANNTVATRKMVLVK
ncbi:MAG: T9SS type A sorting domain-containing protein [Candidatus Cloacimonetes bacterium]|nr:T9SS type A sorting domain-containing protein [Candidatus Cloacimonadota bacterium]